MTGFREDLVFSDTLPYAQISGLESYTLPL